MSDYLLPLLSLSVGAFLGLFSTLLASSVRQRQDITLRLLDQYLLVRKEVVEAVSELSIMSVRNQIAPDKWEEDRSAISKLYYKHYDFLPQAVLDSLTLLDVSLSNRNGMLYSIKNREIVPMGDADAIPFIEACSVFRNTRLAAPMALRSADPTIRSNQAIILHARYVLHTLNKFASIKDLLAITKQLKKAASR